MKEENAYNYLYDTITGKGHHVEIIYDKPELVLRVVAGNKKWEEQEITKTPDFDKPAHVLVNRLKAKGQL